MSAGLYHTYELQQADGGWIVKLEYHDDPPHIFLTLAEALAYLEKVARANFCCEHDAAGNPTRQP